MMKLVPLAKLEINIFDFLLSMFPNETKLLKDYLDFPLFDDRYVTNNNEYFFEYWINSGRFLVNRIDMKEDSSSGTHYPIFTFDIRPMNEKTSEISNANFDGKGVADQEILKRLLEATKAIANEKRDALAEVKL